MSGNGPMIRCGGLDLTIVCRMLRGTHEQVPLFLYIAINDSPQAESFLLQAGDGAYQPDRSILYCYPGESGIGTPGVRLAFFRNAPAHRKLPGTTFSLSEKLGGACIRFAAGGFAGRFALSRRLTDHQLS